MDALSARTSYLNDIEALMTRCNSKLESLVTSVGWTMDSLTKHVKDDGLDEDSMLQDNSVEEKPEAPIPESKDFEKIYNDLIAGLPNQQKKSQEKSEAEVLGDLLELERNTKRRRISYKNKVHAKNKSHTEVLRALVREQMDVLTGSDVKVEGAEGSTPENKEQENDAGLIQLGYPLGNPYTAWRKIGHSVEYRNPCDQSKPHLGRNDTGRWRPDSRRCDREQHQSKRWRHSEDSQLGPIRSEHDRFHRQRSTCESDRDSNSGRPQHVRRNSDRSEHKRRPHRSKSPYRS